MILFVLTKPADSILQLAELAKFAKKPKCPTNAVQQRLDANAHAMRQRRKHLSLSRFAVRSALQLERPLSA